MSLAAWERNFQAWRWLTTADHFCSPAELGCHVRVSFKTGNKSIESRHRQRMSDVGSEAEVVGAAYCGG